MAPQAYSEDHLDSRNGIRHVLLISIDGMHALDYENCVKVRILPEPGRAGKKRSELHAHEHVSALRFFPRIDGPGYRRDAALGGSVL